jgi:hypothetical protein
MHIDMLRSSIRSCLKYTITSGILLICFGFYALAQNPTGTIVGTVKDPSGAVIAGASVTATNRATGLTRNFATQNQGTFRFENLPPGKYEVRVEAQGFATQTQTMEVRVGSVTESTFSMTIGAVTEVIEVSGASMLVSTTESVLNSTFSQSQIDDLPINGRSFLSVATLDPGTTVSYMVGTSSIPTFNSATRISIASPFTGELANVQANIQVDGIRVNDRRVGNTSINFSADTVQEFQLNTLTFDLSAGTSASGVVNTVTRSGGNEYHGSAFIFFRDHNMAAYPGYARSALSPDPYFARKHIGFTLSGPISQDKLMFFASYERNNQVGARSIEFPDPLLYNFNHVGRLPTNGNLGGIRLDYQASEKHNAFLRYNVDQNLTGVAPNYLESYWSNVDNFANQIVTGVTSVFTPTIVNDFRFGFSYFRMLIDNLSPEECARAAGNPDFCVGMGGPRISFNVGGLTIGTHFSFPEGYHQRTYQFTDNIRWTKGTHNISLGGTWDHMNAFGRMNNDTRGAYGTWTPTQLLSINPEMYDALPPSLRGEPGTVVTIPDLMQLPLRGAISTSVGDSIYPSSYRRDELQKNDDFRLYFQDGWNIRPAFTLNYGLAWSGSTTVPVYHMLPWPQYMAPLRIGLDVIPNDWSNWDAALGFAWSPGGGGKTVIRSSISSHAASQNRLIDKWNDQNMRSPAGSGIYAVTSAAVANPKAGQPGQPDTLNFTDPADFTAQDAFDYFPTVKSELEKLFSGYDGKDLSITNIEVIKQTSAGGMNSIMDSDTKNPYSIQFNVGVQREIVHNLGLSVDYVMIRSLKFGAADVYSLDINRWGRFSDYTIDPNTGVANIGPFQNPVLPVCTPAQAGDPKAQCATGPINLRLSNRNGRYNSLQFKLDRRFVGGLQFSVTYALTKTTAHNSIVSWDDLDAGYGISANPKHKFTANATWDVPKYNGDQKLLRGLANGWQLSSIVQGLSGAPKDVTFGNAWAGTDFDLNGDGFKYFRLPGMDMTTWGWSVGADDIRRLVDEYNATYPAPANVALKDVPRSQRDAQGRAFNYVVLPDNFSNNDSFWTADLRLSRTISFREDIKLRLIAEGFNILNISNLTGYSSILDAYVRPAVTGGEPSLPPRGLLFGQPTSRTQSVFGSGGPRAFQFAARLTF